MPRKASGFGKSPQMLLDEVARRNQIPHLYKQIYGKYDDTDQARKSRIQGWLSRGLPMPTYRETSNCECCGEPFTGTPHLDHCHDRHLFRGWLCKRCNTSIAALGDSIEGLQKGIDYLRRSEKETKR